VLQSWYQGNILYKRKTNGITEAVMLYFGVSMAVLATGVLWGTVTGLYVGMGSLALSNLAQTIWLWVRSRRLASATQYENGRA